MSSSISNTRPVMLPKLAERHVYGNEQQGRFLTKYPEELNPTYFGTELTNDIKDNKFSRQLGKKSYELKDHLGNVRVTFSDIKCRRQHRLGHMKWIYFLRVNTLECFVFFSALQISILAVNALHLLLTELPETQYLSSYLFYRKTFREYLDQKNNITQQKLLLCLFLGI